MSATTTGLSNHGKFLRNAAPQEFENFYLAFADYTRNAIDLLVHTTGDLPLAQGRAQQCVNILRVLEEIKNAR